MRCWLYCRLIIFVEIFLVLPALAAWRRKTQRVSRQTPWNPHEYCHQRITKQFQKIRYFPHNDTKPSFFLLANNRRKHYRIRINSSWSLTLFFLLLDLLVGLFFLHGFCWLFLDSFLCVLALAHGVYSFVKKFESRIVNPSTVQRLARLHYSDAGFFVNHDTIVRCFLNNWKDFRALTDWPASLISPRTLEPNAYWFKWIWRQRCISAFLTRTLTGNCRDWRWARPMTASGSLFYWPQHTGMTTSLKSTIFRIFVACG